MRPPWMAEVPETQEQFPAWRQAPVATHSTCRGLENVLCPWFSSWGVTVLDVTCAQLPAALVERYLAIKREGLL